MIAIKEMDIPIRCENCKFCINQRTNDYGSWGDCLLQKNKRVNCLVWRRDGGCPLVKIVTCKDCKYNNTYTCDFNGYGIDDDFYCANAERKEK